VDMITRMIIMEITMELCWDSEERQAMEDMVQITFKEELESLR